VSIADIIRGEERTRLKSHRMAQLKPGDRIQKHSAGGAGVGNPKEREPEKVLDDVLDEFISVDVARVKYGVAINPQTMAVDWEETRKLRAVS